MNAKTRLCLQVMSVWHELKATIVRLATDHDLTMQQTFLLWNLHQNGSIVMSGLAKRLQCDASNITGIVDRLEVRGLVTRTTVSGDRRAKQLEITQAGREIIDSMLARLPQGLCFNNVSHDDIEETTAILKRLQTRT